MLLLYVWPSIRSLLPPLPQKFVCLFAFFGGGIDKTRRDAREHTVLLFLLKPLLLYNAHAHPEKRKEEKTKPIGSVAAIAAFAVDAGGGEALARAEARPSERDRFLNEKRENPRASLRPSAKQEQARYHRSASCQLPATTTPTPHWNVRYRRAQPPPRSSVGPMTIKCAKKLMARTYSRHQQDEQHI